jgi:CO/xanthine dehydrogenase FAD-binding subunit
VKAAAFEYHRPATVAEAVAALGALGEDAALIAGGQSLVPLMNLRLARPAHLVDVGGIPELCGIRAAGDGLAIGAATTQRELERSDLVAQASPLLREAVRLVAHPTIRNRGTLGGSLAHADPAAELPAVVLLLDGELAAVGPAGTRTIAARDFFRGVFETALEADEVLTEIRLPSLPPGAGWAIDEVSRRDGDYALAGAAAVVEPGTGVRLALFGLGATPLRAREAEALAARSAEWAEVAAAAVEATEPFDDVHASARYRHSVARTLVERVLMRAAERSAA